MPPNIHTFFFGRLHVISAAIDRRRFLYEALTSGASEQLGRFKYSFFNIQDMSLSGEDFVFGRLVKYKPILEGEVVDERKHEVIEGGLPDGVVAKSEFFLHYRTSVIAYRPLASRISAGQFRHVFSRLVEAGHEKFFVDTAMESIEEELKIEEAIQRLDIVRRISIEIHPTNPSNRRIYENVDARLKALEAERLRQTIEGGEKGLNKNYIADDDSYRGLVMAADGYGRGSIEGIINGSKVVITTQDSPVRKDVPASESPEELLLNLLPTYQRIWDRIKE